MTNAVPLLESDSLENCPNPVSRQEVLARYRALRGICRHHNREVSKLISRDTILQQSRRLGLVQGKTYVLEDPEEMTFAFDLAIHTAPADRSRAIDRYARSAAVAPGSDEKLVLDAMRGARFAILRIERRHEAAGLVATDLMRDTEEWLVDIGLESSAVDGSVMATRLYTPDRFSMTAGINVPLEAEIVSGLDAELPPYLKAKSPMALADDRRFTETIYRIALANSIMERTRYRDLPAEVP